MSEEKNNQWLETFANFRGGAVLTEIIKEEEPYIREPYWLSPLFSEAYRRYHSFEVEGIGGREDFPLTDAGPLWDGVCKDDKSRKYLFIQAVDSPAALRGDGGDLPAAEKEAMAKVFRMLNLDGDLETWYHEFYPVAKALTFTALLGDVAAGYLPRGYRAELVILGFIDNFLGEKTAKEVWEAFFEEMIAKMFGPRGIPYVIFTVLFEV